MRKAHFKISYRNLKDVCTAEYKQNVIHEPQVIKTSFDPTWHCIATSKAFILNI